MQIKIKSIYNKKTFINMKQESYLSIALIALAILTIFVVLTEAEVSKSAIKS